MAEGWVQAACGTSYRRGSRAETHGKAQRQCAGQCSRGGFLTFPLVLPCPLLRAACWIDFLETNAASAPDSRARHGRNYQ